MTQGMAFPCLVYLADFVRRRAYFKLEDHDFLLPLIDYRS